MKYFKKLVGERIYLSPMNVEDTETYLKWMSDFSVSDGFAQSARNYNLTSQKEWIESSLKNCSQQFAIVRLEDDKLIGNCFIDGINHIRRIGTVGLFIGDKENRSKGYGKEALNLLLEYGFRYLNLNNIMLQVFLFNEIAMKCYQNVGFKEFGRRRKAYFLNGKYYDEIYMDILDEEFTGDYIRNKNF